MRSQLVARHGQNIFDADRDQNAVDRLPRPAFLQEVEKGKPALFVGLGVGVLRGIAAGGVDQHRLLGEPPVAIARSADPRNRRRRRAPRQRKLQSGIDQRRGLAGPGRTDNDVPGQIVEISRLAAARRLQGRQRVLHTLLENRLVVDGLLLAADAFGNLLGGVSAVKEIEPAKTRSAGYHKQNDDVADNGVIERVPVAKGDERPRQINNGDHRAEPETEQNRARNLLPKHLAGACYSLRSMKISTRRFLARPSGVVLGAIGSSGPLPAISTRDGSARPVLSTAATALARSTDNSKLEGNLTLFIGELSVCPTILMRPGSLSSVAATRAATGLKASSTVACAEANRTRSQTRITIKLGVWSAVMAHAVFSSANALRIRCNWVMR